MPLTFNKLPSEIRRQIYSNLIDEEQEDSITLTRPTHRHKEYTRPISIEQCKVQIPEESQDKQRTLYVDMKDLAGVLREGYWMAKDAFHYFFNDNICRTLLLDYDQMSLWLNNNWYCDFRSGSSLDFAKSGIEVSAGKTFVLANLTQVTFGMNASYSSYGPDIELANHLADEGLCPNLQRVTCHLKAVAPMCKVRRPLEMATTGLALLAQRFRENFAVVLTTDIIDCDKFTSRIEGTRSDSNISFDYLTGLADKVASHWRNSEAKKSRRHCRHHGKRW